jgi:hypothetical protein
MARKKPKSNEKGNPKRDQCQTPPRALWPLLPYVNKSWRVWEPCAGKGNLVRGLVRYGIRNVVKGDILTGQNFFDPKSEPAIWDAQITNPPFSIKYKWLKRSYELGKPFALLVPVDTLGAKTAQALFSRYGVEVIFMNERINYEMPNIGFSGSGAQFASIWITWGLDIGRQMTFAKLVKPEHAKQIELL